MNSPFPSGPVAGAYLTGNVDSGEYASVTEVLLDALLLLQQRDVKLTQLRAAIQEGADSGEGIPADEVLAGLDALIAKS